MILFDFKWFWGDFMRFYAISSDSRWFQMIFCDFKWFCVVFLFRQSVLAHGVGGRVAKEDIAITVHSLQGPYDESGVIVSTSPVVFGGESVNICSDLHKAPSVAIRSQMKSWKSGPWQYVIDGLDSEFALVANSFITKLMRHGASQQLNVYMPASDGDAAVSQQLLLLSGIFKSQTCEDDNKQMCT